MKIITLMLFFLDVLIAINKLEYLNKYYEYLNNHDIIMIINNF